MTNKPIVFSTEMVRAILAGRKTQTRRIIKEQPNFDDFESLKLYCPYGAAGDRLWVREVFAYRGKSILYKADLTREELAEAKQKRISWISPIYMTRQESRIALELLRVICMELHRMSDADAIAEGVTVLPGERPCDAFEFLWESIHGKGSWQSNPWVWELEFKKI